MKPTSMAVVIAVLAACSPETTSEQVAPDAPPQEQTGIRCDPSGPGACENENDCPFATDGSAAAVAKRCGLACSGSTEERCTADCITAETSLSSGCADCLSIYIDCVIDNCVVECLSSEMACGECQRVKPSVEASCQSTFQSCSGLAPAE